MKWRIGLLLILIGCLFALPEATFADGSEFVRWGVNPQGPDVEIRLMSSRRWNIETTDWVFPYIPRTPPAQTTLWLPKDNLVELRLTDTQGNTWAAVSFSPSHVCGLETIVAKTGASPLEVHLRNDSEVIYNAGTDSVPGTIRVFPGELESLSFPGTFDTLTTWIEGDEKNCQEVRWDFSGWETKVRCHLPLVFRPHIR